MMNLKPQYLFLIFGFVTQAHAQQLVPPRINAYLDFTRAKRNQEGIATFSYVRNWRLGKSRKLELGLGLRWTSYIGTKREFYTAPARLARSSSVPFVNVFSGHEDQNVDTLTVLRPFTNSLNLLSMQDIVFQKNGMPV